MRGESLFFPSLRAQQVPDVTNRSKFQQFRVLLPLLRVSWIRSRSYNDGGLSLWSSSLACRDTAAVNTDLCSTDIRADLLERWAQVARDPGVGVCGWLKYEANAGLSSDPVGLEGVFPADTREEPGDEAVSAQDGVAKSSVGDDPDAAKHIQEYVNQG